MKIHKYDGKVHSATFTGKGYGLYVQWNPSKPDTVGPNSSVLYSEVALTEGKSRLVTESVELPYKIPDSVPVV